MQSPPWGGRGLAEPGASRTCRRPITTENGPFPGTTPSSAETEKFSHGTALTGTAGCGSAQCSGL